MDAKFTFAQELVRQAGQLVRELMTSPYAITAKSRFDDLVTSVDKEVQNFMVSRILERYPEDAILAEENNVRHDVHQGKVWVIDPIDGTVNFIVQGEHFTILLAYFEEGLGQFGLIYDVMADSLMLGGPHFPVTYQGTEVPLYQEKPLHESLLGVNGAMFASNVRGLRDLAEQTLGVRIYGGSGLSMSMVLRGELLGYFSHLYPWDYAAGAIIGQALGYQLVTLTGEAPDWKSRQMVMLIPQAKRDEILSFLKSKD
ncbi:inositol monophosphatase family protein [Streptococcus sp. DD12]|uniref:inositol monophosphatase family protein n=1 Tax=Streptococcus sp. DD12 TaxID=1777880 RepID=UPI000830674D|nr:inositol monophosphatase family protein [Streptococcus sp. DD12]